MAVLNKGKQLQELAKGNEPLNHLLQIHTAKDEHNTEQRNPKPEKQLKVVRMSSVEPEPVEWLWKPYIPIGKITLLEGDPAAGKTWTALAIAAAITKGVSLPSFEDGKPKGISQSGNVIYLSAEDGPSDTLRPRLDVVGAAPDRVYVITGTQDTEGNENVFSFDDIALLDTIAASLKPRLVVVDPLQAYLGAGVDMHRANETRPVLSRLANLAEKHSCAVLCIRHLSKANTGRAMYRGLGSIDFTAAARSVLLAGVDPEEQQTRAIVHLKSSLAPAGPSQGYVLNTDGFFWTGLSDMTAASLLSSEPAGEEKSALDEAIEWLKDYISDGPKEQKDINKEAKKQGISSITLRRAKDKLKVVVKKRPTKNGPWEWRLPDEVDHEDETSYRTQNDHLQKSSENVGAQGMQGLFKDNHVITFNNTPGGQQPQGIERRFEDDHFAPLGDKTNEGDQVQPKRRVIEI